MGGSGRTWAVLKGTIEGKPITGMVDTQYATFRDRYAYPWYLRICIPLVDPDPTGMANSSDNHPLEQLQEEILEPTLLRTCSFHLVGRVTYGSWRELWYYIDSPIAAVALNDLIEGGSVRQFTFGCYWDDEWAEVAPYLAIRRA